MPNHEKMKQLAIAALIVCDNRPHPKAWWDGTMETKHQQRYDEAMATMNSLRDELGLGGILSLGEAEKEKGADAQQTKPR